VDTPWINQAQGGYPNTDLSNPNSNVRITSCYCSPNPQSIFPPIFFLKYIAVPILSSGEPETELPHLRAHIRAAEAFQKAGSLRRRASLLSEYAVTASTSLLPLMESPIAWNIPPHHAYPTSLSTTETLSRGHKNWHSLVGRLRLQLRVVNAFREGYGSQRSIQHGAFRTPDPSEHKHRSGSPQPVRSDISLRDIYQQTEAQMLDLTGQE
jgi:hypothetical protein